MASYILYVESVAYPLPFPTEKIPFHVVMHQFRRRFLLNSPKFTDLLILTIAFGVATLIVQQSGSISLQDFLAMRIKVVNLFLFFGLLLCWHSLFASLGLYHSMRLSSKRTELLEVLKATTLGTVMIFIVAATFNMVMITPLFLAVFWVLTTILTALSRLVLRIFLGRLENNDKNLRNIVVVGSNDRAVTFAETILAKPELGYNLSCFVDTYWAGPSSCSLRDTYPLIPPERLDEYLRNNVVDEVMICLPVTEYVRQYSQIIDTCTEQGIIVRVLADYFFSQLAHARVESFEGRSILTIYTGVLDGPALVFKRCIDIGVSSALLLLLLPLFAAVALLIKCSSPGPIFFVQERLGLNKRIFRLYKFRTMVQDAEKLQKELEPLNEAQGPVFKIRNDPRITREGRFLRTTSIDELPQLLNVLKGDMSLVGPRPLPVRDYKGFDQSWFNRRFSVRPGMTCLWQIDGRNDIPFEKWIRLDLQYIDNWSLLLDFRILLRTIPAVLAGRGAA